jgi:hypothetical protein
MRTGHRPVGWVPCGVEPAHPSSSPRLGTGARIFLDLFQDLTVLCFQWKATPPSAARCLWLLRESQDMRVQSFEGVHRGRVCVCMFIGVSVRACVGIYVVLCNSKKMLTIFMYL